MGFGESMQPAVPKDVATFLLCGWNPIWRQWFGAATKRCAVRSGRTMRQRQAFTDKEKQDRKQRTSDAARELIEVERAARDAKTARLREQRLRTETALPGEPAPKPKRNWKSRSRSGHAAPGAL